MRTSIPTSAWVLGYAGLIPFIGPVIGEYWLGPKSLIALELLQLQQTYGAIILSFMGAIHWGVEMVEHPEAPRFNVLASSASPALFGWLCLRIDSSQLSLWGLAAAFAVVLLYDLSRSKESAVIPEWYSVLRIPLSVGAIVSLTAMSFA